MTILNIKRPNVLPENEKWEYVVGDGTNLQYSDASFDLVFSNSVIEHVGDSASQKRFADEMLRVGRRIYCQTPNKWFFVEPHLIAPFIHWLPFRVQRRLVRWLSVWGWVTRPDQTQIDKFLLDTRLLSYRELRALFPGREIQRERFMLMTKSYIVTN